MVNLFKPLSKQENDDLDKSLLSCTHDWLITGVRFDTADQPEMTRVTKFYRCLICEKEQELHVFI